MKIRLWLLACLLCPVAWPLDGGIREIGGAVESVPLPDLTVKGVVIQPGWVPAQVQEPRFLHLLDVDLQDMALTTGTEIILNRILPENNCAVVTCRSRYLLAQSESDDGLFPTETWTYPDPVPPMEIIRQQLLALPYVKGCLHNSGEYPEPASIPAAGAVNPTEFVLLFTGRPLPLLLLTAQMGVTTNDWNALVTAETMLTCGMDGTVADRFRTPLILHNGTGEFTRPISLPPGDYTVTITIDPDNRILEANEDNNTGIATVNSAVMLMQLTLPPPGRIESGAEVSGDITLVNFRPTEFVIRRDQIQFELDGTPLTVTWLPLLPAATGGTTNPADGWLLKPGNIFRFEFRFTVPETVGEHRLKAQLTATGTSAEIGFTVIQPELGLNFRPACEEHINDTVKVAPLRNDPTIAALLRHAVLNSFAMDPAFLEVRLIATEMVPGTDSAMLAAGNRLSPVHPTDAGDLFLVLRFLENPPSREKISAFAQTLNTFWFVAEAQLLPVLATDLRMVLEESVGIPDRMTFTPWNTFRIGVRLAHDAEIREMTRLMVPVIREQAPVADLSVSLRPPRYVAVAITREPANTEVEATMPCYQTWICGNGPERAPAAAYFPCSGLPLTYQVTVDPANTVAESDESDNDCSFQEQPVLKPQFAARAWLEWDSIPAAGPLRPVLLLKVQGIMVNPGPVPAVLVFPTALQLDFTWESYYRWSTGKMFAQVVTRVEIPADDKHFWEIQAPLAEIWQVLARPGCSPDLPNVNLVLNVELSGTDYRQKVPVKSVLMSDSLDVDSDLLPDDWEAEWLQTAGNLNPDTRHDGNADDDLDGWPDLLEFIYNTNPKDSDSKPFGRLFILELVPGWNLISLPVEPVRNQVQDLFGMLPIGPVWECLTDPATGQIRYGTVDNLESGKAYWLFVTETAEIPVAGTSPEPHPLYLGKGWNLIGAPEGDICRDDPLEPTVWTWSALRQNYEVLAPDQELVEGQGYWIAARRTCEIQVSGQ